MELMLFLRVGDAFAGVSKFEGGWFLSTWHTLVVLDLK
jgi:hypothetical protein